ncbi:DUF4339 domain-containing protein [Bradyrhizobium sp. McL0615]|uniref:DUF4339 domain-containing protein n=1 Tax=Bradyrhizobium sp. McL0615 TaxID=3415673 RepID=UPI003CF4D82D
MIWHVIIDGEQRGPLSHDQVLEYLHSGQLVGHDLIWRPGFRDWKPISELADFWQPPKRESLPPPLPAPAERAEHDDTQTVAVVADRKWSLWGATNIGLMVSVFVLSLQIASGRGFELANYAQTASAETVMYLAGQIIAAPLIFVIVAMVVNIFRWRLPASDARAIKGATVFVISFVGIGMLLALYGQWFFSSTERISGATRDYAMKSMQPVCVRRQMSLRQGQNLSDEQISKYCQCVGIHIADNTTYKGLTRDSNAPDVVEYLKRQAETAGRECRTWMGL